jgi:hypothetical protein
MSIRFVWTNQITLLVRRAGKMPTLRKHKPELQ